MDEALYFPVSGRTALLIGIEESKISRGISKKDGPNDPFLVSLNAIETISAHLSVDITVEANLVMGCIMSTCGRSWRDPILCWVRELCPPIKSIGISALNAFATPVRACVVPGPAVTTAQPGFPVILA